MFSPHRVILERAPFFDMLHYAQNDTDERRDAKDLDGRFFYRRWLRSETNLLAPSRGGSCGTQVGEFDVHFKHTDSFRHRIRDATSLKGGGQVRFVSKTDSNGYPYGR